MYISGNRRDKDVNNQDNRNLLHPSMLQIQYLLELEKTGKSLLKVWAAVGRQNGVFYEDNKS